jgi:hypothetical protein
MSFPIRIAPSLWGFSTQSFVASIENTRTSLALHGGHEHLTFISGGIETLKPGLGFNLRFGSQRATHCTQSVVVCIKVIAAPQLAVIWSDSVVSRHAPTNGKGVDFFDSQGGFRTEADFLCRS